MEVCDIKEVSLKKCAFLFFLSPIAWNWDMSPVVLMTTQDENEGHTLVILGQKAGNSLSFFGAYIPILDYFGTSLHMREI